MQIEFAGAGWEVTGFCHILAALLTFGSAASAAQTVRGTATERGTGVAIPGVLVSLVNDSNKTVATTLTDAWGRFTVRAPAAGEFLLESKRIGIRHHRGRSFTLAMNETRREDVVLDPVVPALAPVRVAGTSRCVRGPDDDVRLVALWEDARAALLATVLTAQHAETGTISRFARTLDANTRRVLKDERHELHGNIGRPFESVPIQRLARDGYVVHRDDGSTDFYAPDADVLLSEQFLDDHCFRLVADPEPGHGRTGLGFDPVGRGRIPDVSGVLWLDAATSELRELEFHYTSLPKALADDGFGGSVRFTRLPTGRWIIDDWVIRMPVLGARDGTYFSIAGAPAMVLPSRRDVLVAVREEGGTVRLDGAHEVEPSSIAGVVFDSTTGSLAVGATITLGGTRHATRTGADGHFTIPDVAPGLYAVAFSTPMLDSLGVAVGTTSVRVSTPGITSLALTIPAPASLVARMCDTMPNLAERAVMRMIVVDRESGAPLRDERAQLWWRRYTGSFSDHNLAEHVAGVTIRLDDAGSYTACDLPAGRVIHIESRPYASFVWSDTLKVTAGEIGWRVRRVERFPAGRAPASLAPRRDLSDVKARPSAEMPNTR